MDEGEKSVRAFLDLELLDISQSTSRTMVSFSCEVCNDTIKKPKLDQHAGRCRGAYFTCIDCNTTFDGPAGPNGYSKHTSCISEEQKYQKSVYKAPKGKGNKQQQNQNQPPAAASPAPAQAPVPAPVAAPTPAEPAAAPTPSKKDKKRAREDEQATEPAKEEPKQAEQSEEAKETGADEPAKKKKKNKKNKDKSANSADGADSAAPAKESLASFLSAALPPLMSDSVSLFTLREKVLAQAKEKGFADEKEVEKALWDGVKVGGKKKRVTVEFA
ncbi:hypothetical protein JCM1840_004832 [Sporobolomyces johnsonii]